MNTLLKKITLFAFSIMFAFGGTFAPLSVAFAEGTTSMEVSDGGEEIVTPAEDETPAPEEDGEKVEDQTPDTTENDGASAEDEEKELGDNSDAGDEGTPSEDDGSSEEGVPTEKPTIETFAPMSIVSVDTEKPVGNATYSGGNLVGDVIYLSSIEDLSFTETVTDNQGVVRATYLVQKLNTTTNTYEGFCGNWNAAGSGSHDLGGTTNETYTENNIENCKSGGTSAWTDGTYKIFHAAYDAAGNEGKYNTNRQVFVIDNTNYESEIVTGDTASAENQPGWLFNRDTTTTSPFEFTNNEHSVGEGSLYVLPITNTLGTPGSKDKFIAELFAKTEITEFNSFSYDVMMAAGNENKINVSVYANIDNSDNYYDCRFDYIPSGTSTSSFTTVTFDKNDTPVHVQQRGTRTSCPATLADMQTGSFVRVFAINIGDTSENDLGLSAYLDKVVLDTNSTVTTYDFEPIAIPTCSSDDTTFDTFSNGSVNGQNGWEMTGSYDVEVVDNTYGINSFGCKSLRISNAVTTGAFGNQTFSYSTPNEAGEIDSTSNGMSTGPRVDHYEAEFDIASTMSSQQSGLAISVSPDRGDGSRMSYLSFTDTPDGIDVTFYDVQGENAGFQQANFVATTIADGLPRTEPHTIKFVIDYLDGPSNDVVEIYIDGSLAHEGTTWENYYRFDTEASAEQTPRTTDSLIFRSAGTAVSANSGNGFLIDNVNITTSQNASTLTTPILLSPANDIPFNGTTAFANDWEDVDGATSYVYQSYNVDGNGECNLSSPRFNATYTNSQTNTRSLPDGLMYCWQVKAIDASLNESDWSDLWKTVIDNTAPTAPEIITPTNEQVFTTTPILNDWTDSLDDNGVDHYQIEYVYDDGHTFSGAPYRETTVSQRNHTPSLSEQGGVIIRVRAFDAAGNVSDWSNSVHYIYDTEPTPNTAPVLTLNGDTIMNLFVGDTFTDPGATATDAEDGDISSAIVVSGDIVDTSAAGTYMVTYNVTDSGGISAEEITLTVIVETPTSDSDSSSNSSPTSTSRRIASFGTSTTASTAGRVLGAESYNFTLLLKRGSRGNEVMELQKFLNNAGYNSGPVDGIFGPITEAAVKAFQTANGLVADGIVGPLTRAVLNA